MYQLKKKKKHNLSNSRNARHTILTLQNFDVFLPVDSFSTIAKNEVWSSNHMHLFTSKTLSNYKKPQIRGVQEGEGGNGGMDKNFLQGKIHYWMSSQTVSRINVHFFWKCS